MYQDNLLALDLAKNSHQACFLDKAHQEKFNRTFSSSKLIEWLSSQAPSPVKGPGIYVLPRSPNSPQVIKVPDIKHRPRTALDEVSNDLGVEPNSMLALLGLSILVPKFHSRSTLQGQSDSRSTDVSKTTEQLQVRSSSLLS